jgi:hypothetical protein
MKSRIRAFAAGNSKVLAVGVIAALLAGTTGAVGASLVKSGNIKNGTIKLKDLNKKLRKKLNRSGAVGPRGPQGPQGPPGETGPSTPGADFDAGNWGEIARNTIGSPHVALRAGPFGSFGVTGDAGAPPYGEGSLGISVADDATAATPSSEKAAFGNEVDFLGDDVTAIDEIGFHVFQTDENTDVGGNEATPRNLPGITFELDPNVGGASAGVNYTSLVYLPEAVTTDNRWSGYIDAAAAGGDWFFTNATLAGQTGCNQTTYCDWDGIKAALGDSENADPPAVYTLAVAKGRDNRWVGAVDGLRVDDDVFDFEPLGVSVTTP